MKRNFYKRKRVLVAGLPGLSARGYKLEAQTSLTLFDTIQAEDKMCSVVVTYGFSKIGTNVFIGEAGTAIVPISANLETLGSFLPHNIKETRSAIFRREAVLLSVRKINTFIAVYARF